MKYFAHCTTLDQLQQTYRELLKQYHPDRHPGAPADHIAEMTRITQLVNAEYAAMAAVLRSTEARAKAKSDGKPEPTAFDFENWARVDESIRQTIEKIVFLPDLQIEICGFWIWVGGDTKPVKEQLKQAGLRWSPNKEKWYYAGIPSSSRGGFSLDDIRSRYGSTRVKSQSRTRLEDER